MQEHQDGELNTFVAILYDSQSKLLWAMGEELYWPEKYSPAKYLLLFKNWLIINPIASHKNMFFCQFSGTLDLLCHCK